MHVFLMKIFQLAHIEERGKLNLMKEFDETTIWTSDRIPLMASYNTGSLDAKLLPPFFFFFFGVKFIYNLATSLCRKDATFCVGCGNQ